MILTGVSRSTAKWHGPYDIIRKTGFCELCDLNGTEKLYHVIILNPTILSSSFHSAHGRVTNCGVSGLGFKSPGSILLLEQKPFLYHEWSGMAKTHDLYRKVGDKSLLLWNLRLGRWTATTACSENYNEIKKKTLVAYDHRPLAY